VGKIEQKKSMVGFFFHFYESSGRKKLMTRVKKIFLHSNVGKKYDATKSEKI
jgi:hypothetical protein